MEKVKFVFRLHFAMKFLVTLLLLLFIQSISYSNFINNDGATQGKTISGKVIDSKGNTLPGVTILEKGTTNGTATDLNGNYSITVTNGDAILIFSFVGMLNQEIQIGVQTVIDVTMEDDLEVLEEVVVIGYGMQKKADLTGSVATIDVKSLEKLGTSNVALALQGMAAGVSVSASGGEPGGSVDILVRGVGTLNDNTPLYVIDGVPQETMYYLNPEDIESVSILKDAASAAIYGTRGSNGVILINTKRGDKGTAKISFKAYYGMQNFNKFMPAVTNSADFVRLARMGVENAGLDVADYAFIGDYEASPASFPNSDWQKEYFSGGAQTEKYDFSISGGADNINYSLSAMYNKEEGVIVRTKREKMSVRINTDVKFSEKLKVGESFSVGRSGGRWVNFSDQSYQLLSLPPTVPIRDASNEEGWGYATTTSGYAKIGNPVAAQHIYDNRDDDIHLFGSGYLEFEPIKNLKYTFRASQTIQFWHDYEYTPEFNVGGDFQAATTRLSEERARKYHTVIDHTLSYHLAIDDHNIDLLAGASRERALYRNMSGEGQELPAGLYVLDQAQESQGVGGSEFDSRLQSVFGRISYNYKNKYLQLPIIFQYKFLQNTRCQFFVDAGLFFSNWVSGKIKGAIPNVFNSYDSINSSGQIKHYLRYTNYSEKYQFNSVKDNRYEFGALLGITTIYQLNQKYSIFYSVRFCQSFVSQQKKYSINQTAQYNQTIMISIGCKFSLHDLKMNDHAK